MMKKMLFVLMGLVLFSASVSFAANEPYLISFQGKLEGVTSPQTIVFNLYNAKKGGTSVWDETHSGVTFESDGIINILLGQGTAFANQFFDNAGTGLWMEVKVGADVLSPRQALTAAPYAFVARDLKGGIVHAVSDKSLIPAIYGDAREQAGDNPGVKGYSVTGVGVHGHKASTADNDNAAVYGQNERMNAGDNPGVLGFSISGYGVKGSGNLAGVYGIASGANAAGVRGHNDAGHGIHGTQGGANPNNYAGVYGSSATGYGVMGNATGTGKAGVVGTGGAGHGVSGSTLSGSHAGVYGLNGYANGKGVMGEASNINGYGVYGKATNTDGSGVYGISSYGNGIHGKTESSAATYAGVKGEGTYRGVVGSSSTNSTVAYGVYGTAVGSGKGVAGSSLSGSGVEGSSTNGNGVVGSGNIGVKANGATAIFADANTTTGKALDIQKGKLSVKSADQTVYYATYNVNEKAGILRARYHYTMTTTTQKREIIINNSYINANSLVFLTVKRVSGNIADVCSAYIVEQTDEGKLRIRLNRDVDSNNTFDIYFLVIN